MLPIPRVPANYSRLLRHLATWRRLEIASLSAILLAYALLAAQYSTATPILESYDERFHFAYVLSIALDHGLPVQNVDLHGPWGNEGSQPPLFYSVAAVLTSWTVRSGFEDEVVPNPYTTGHLDAAQNDNRNYFIHHRSEDFPYSGNVLAFHLVRWLSVLLGGIAVLATFLTGKLIVPAHPWV